MSSVVEQVTPWTIEARGADDRWYELRIAPYKTNDHRIEGVVLTFTDLDGLRQRAALSQRAEALAGVLVGALPHPALLLDSRLRVTWVNEAFLQMLQEPGRDPVGRLLHNLEGPWADARLRASLDRVALEGRSFGDLTVSVTGPHGAARTLRLSGSRVHLPTPGVGVGTPVLLIAWTETHADPEEAR